MIEKIKKPIRWIWDAHGTHSTFYTSMFNSSITDLSWLSSWNIDVLLDSIKQLVSVLPFTSSQSLYQLAVFVEI